MPTALHVTPEELAAYQATARRRSDEEVATLRARYERAWTLAREAASLLRRDFGATKVAVFGSLLDPERFTRWSDVDLAAWGINPGDTFRALGVVQDLSDEIPLNLVDVQTCRPGILHEIERDGVPI